MNFFLLYILFTFHPIHISVSEVEISANKITWTARIYTDDLLLAVYGKNATIAMTEDPEKTRDDIYRYLTSQISLKVNNKPVEWQLVEIHPDPEAIWITVSADIEGSVFTSILIGNTILFDVYKDQKNIINLNAPACKKNIVFERGDEARMISILN